MNPAISQAKVQAAISSKKYAQLLKEQLPRVIRSDNECQHMLKTVHDFMALGQKRTPEQTELLHLMIVLVDTYEQSHSQHSMESVTPVDVLSHLMEEHKHNPKDLWEVVGDKATVSKILSRERSISKTVARRLADFYHVSPALFI